MKSDDTPVDVLEQWFSTFFGLRHPSQVIEQFGGTHNYNLLFNRFQVQKLVAPLEFFMGPRGSTSPRLRTSVLE